MNPSDVNYFIGRELTEEESQLVKSDVVRGLLSAAFIKVRYPKGIDIKLFRDRLKRYPDKVYYKDILLSVEQVMVVVAMMDAIFEELGLNELKMLKSEVGTWK